MITQLQLFQFVTLSSSGGEEFFFSRDVIRVFDRGEKNCLRFLSFKNTNTPQKFFGVTVYRHNKENFHMFYFQRCVVVNTFYFHFHFYAPSQFFRPSFFHALLYNLVSCIQTRKHSEKVKMLSSSSTMFVKSFCLETTVTKLCVVCNPIRLTPSPCFRSNNLTVRNTEIKVSGNRCYSIPYHDKYSYIL